MQGHQAGIIALNDKHSKEEFNGVQESDNIVLPVLRLPSNWISVKRFKRAGLWIDDFRPEWLSLQFVPFAFHPKGLAFGMKRFLHRFGKGKRWHIMVHELWVGMDKEASLKFVYWGWFQRQLIKSLFVKLKPAVIHTHTILYIKMLEKIGFKPQYLPLFGNIPVIPKDAENDLHNISGNTLGKLISFVVFGGIHPGAPIDKLARELKIYSNNRKIKVVLKIIGRCGYEQLRWEKEWEAAGLSIELFGEQSQERISDVLTNSSFGISTTPASLIEKSGSVAAMREHSLTILCISRPWHPRGIKYLDLPAGVVQYKEGEIQDFIAHNCKGYRANNLSDITHQFVNNLLFPL